VGVGLGAGMGWGGVGAGEGLGWGGVGFFCPLVLLYVSAFCLRGGCA